MDFTKTSERLALTSTGKESLEGYSYLASHSLLEDREDLLAYLILAYLDRKGMSSLGTIERTLSKPELVFLFRSAINTLINEGAIEVV